MDEPHCFSRSAAGNHVSIRVQSRAEILCFAHVEQLFAGAVHEIDAGAGRHSAKELNAEPLYERPRRREKSKLLFRHAESSARLRG